MSAPAVIACFRAGLQDCSFSQIAAFLTSLQDGTSTLAPRARLPRSLIEPAVAAYADTHIRPGEPDHFSHTEFAALFCNAAFGSLTHAPLADLMPFLAALTKEYGASPFPRIFPAVHPPHIALVLSLDGTPADLANARDLAARITATFKPRMPNTAFRFEFAQHDTQIAAVRTLFRSINTPGTDTDTDTYFAILNHPPPMHDNYLFMLQHEITRRNSPPVVALCDGRAASDLSLAPVPLSHMAARADVLEAFCASSFFTQIAALNLRMWHAAASQFLAFVPNASQDTDKQTKTKTNNLKVAKWPFSSQKESITRGVDMDKARLETAVVHDRIPQITAFLADPENSVEPPGPAVRAPNPAPYDPTVPPHAKPRREPAVRPFEAPNKIDYHTRLMYFAVLHEAVCLNVLASFSPAQDTLRSPAALMATAKPPQQLALTALHFVCETQKGTLAKCIAALQG